MIILHFAVYDEIIQSYGITFSARNSNEAIRTFHNAFLDPTSNISKHPQDFSLYLVGSFNDETAEFNNVFPKELLARASQFQEK